MSTCAPYLDSNAGDWKMQNIANWIAKDKYSANSARPADEIHTECRLNERINPERKLSRCFEDIFLQSPEIEIYKRQVQDFTNTVSFFAFKELKLRA